VLDLINFRKSSEWVSIIMPVRNAEPFLEECLNSIIEQSHTEWELIAIDDHSDDNSLETLNQYALNDPRIIVFGNEGRGIIDALQLAQSHATGKYITRMDADDIMSLNKLELMVEALERENELAIGLVKYISEKELGNGYEKYEDWLNSLTIGASNFSEMYKECTIPSPCWMMYRTGFDRIGGFEGLIYPEDYDLSFRFFNSSLNLKPVIEVLHYWRDHPSRASRNDPNYLDNRFIALKVSKFLQINRIEKQDLVLWGAGAKGKAIAKLLIASNIDFQWITNNERKQGKTIYSKILKGDADWKKFEYAQFIVAIAGAELDELRSNINAEQSSGRTFYFFA